MNHSFSNTVVLDCKICGSNETCLAYQFKRFDLFRCQQCSHLFSHVKEQPEDYKGHYFFGDKKEYFEHPDEKMYLKLHGLIQKLHPARKTSYRVLDVGTGIGTLPKFFNQLGYDGYGIDISDEAIRHGAEVLGIPNLNAAPIESYHPASQFDVVICNNVIEHVPDPVSLSRHAYRLLNDNGLFVCITVDSNSPIFRLSEFLYKSSNGMFRKSLERVCDVHHLHHFNQVSLARALRASNFDVLHCFGWELPIESLSLTPSQRISVRAAYILSTLVNSHFLQGVVCVKSPK